MAPLRQVAVSTPRPGQVGGETLCLSDPEQWLGEGGYPPESAPGILLFCRNLSCDQEDTQREREGPRGVGRAWFWSPCLPLLTCDLGPISKSPGFPLCRVGITRVPASRTGTVVFSSPSSPKGTSVFVIITKMIVTENQMQGFCPEVRRGREVG